MFSLHIAPVGIEQMKQYYYYQIKSRFNRVLCRLQFFLFEFWPNLSSQSQRSSSLFSQIDPNSQVLVQYAG